MSGAARHTFKVFVGNIPWSVGSSELRHFASSFGPVVHSQVIFNKQTGLNKGYGFVTFGNREGFNAMVKGGRSGIYFLEGQHINASPASASSNNPINSGDE